MHQVFEWKKQIWEFLQKQTEKKKLIVIYGPTGCGKTQVSLEIAGHFGFPIINADSRRIYRGMNIGTSKILYRDMQGIPHYMVDILCPDTSYSVGEYAKEVVSLIDRIHRMGKIPILVGGTGLYIDSVVFGYHIPQVMAHIPLRKFFEKYAALQGREALYQILVALDREYAQTIHPNNLYYVIRALEIRILTGKSKRDFFEKEKKMIYDTLFFTPYDGRRDALYASLERRVQEMFQKGFIEEVACLLSQYPPCSPGFDTIGYREVIEYLLKRISYDTCLSLTIKRTLHYAKRQITWCKRYEAL